MDLLNMEIAMRSDDLLPLERPAHGSPRLNVQESAARYGFAASAVRTLRVLDVASGAGLGSAFLLAHGARIAVGVETAVEAVTQGRMLADAAGPYFVRADALALPFADGSFDVVVSFETIEHLLDAGRLLAECRRVLQPGGLLYLSTPNRTVTRWLPRNPFHVHEFTSSEITNLARQYFDIVNCYWQRPVLLPAFVLRQMARGCLSVIPGGRHLWRLWTRVRPQRTRVGATVWLGSCFDESLLADPHYRVIPARRMTWKQPTYTVLVARC
jgi:SAM-dependent methyltransferase